MRKLALALAALTLLLGAAACGGGEEETAEPDTVEGTIETETQAAGPTEGDAAAGGDLYAAQGCGGCHTFSAANSSGTIGPNLDDSSIEFQAAFTQIANGGGGMPSYKERGLSDEEIANLAAFVTEERG
ncbi:MAG TPA: cytochrome c [Gaiellaceae bacterium]|nr:cytochrome c [Gaiellaceae bacterium]